MKSAASKQSPQQRAALRCCASCEWIYKTPTECPKCGFASYGARYVHGNRAYRFARTQEPWRKRKIDLYALTLKDEIYLTNSNIKNKSMSIFTSNDE